MMTEKIDGRRNNGGARPKTRADDRRGHRPPGQPHVMPFEATDDQRAKVKEYARVCNDDQIAILVGISVSTLQRHFRAELDEGRAQVTATIGAKLIAQALAGDKASMIFYLKTRGGWSQKHELVGKDGGPIRTFDLSGYSPEQLKLLMPIIDQLIAEMAEQDSDD
jgi:AraC-like DNA-binding protein